MKSNLNPILRPMRLESEPVRPVLVFDPLCWLKLQYFCHRGQTEIGGFAISNPDNPLYIEDFQTVLQGTSSVTVEFADSAVADYFDRSIDAGLKPCQFARIWLHTHPGESAQPSGVDENTFADVFGKCDWAVMFILSRTGRTYARLAFSAGPGGSIQLPVSVDWESWPRRATQSDLQKELSQWAQEFESNIHPLISKPFPKLMEERLEEMDLWYEEQLLLDACQELGNVPQIEEAPWSA